MARNTSSMSILCPLLLVLFLGIGAHTDARKFSTQILHGDVPPPKHSDFPAALRGYTTQISWATSRYDVPPPQSNNDPPDPNPPPSTSMGVSPPEFNTPLEEPPVSTDNGIKNSLREELATMAYHLEWVCDSNNPSHPKCRGNKFSWPELVGKQGKEAKVVVQKENPYIDAVDYAPQDAIVTDNYCCNRVRLIMNCDDGCDYENATVFQVPIVG